MSTTKLLETLLDIDRRLGRADTLTLRHLLMDAQNQVLHLQKDVVQLLEEMQGLRESRETQLPSGSWRAVVQGLAVSEAEKEAARPTGPVAVVDRAS